MAASITIEEERGTYVRTPHRHNGYYAADFSRPDLRGSAFPTTVHVTSQGESS